jgi:hypothetical protein
VLASLKTHTSTILNVEKLIKCVENFSYSQGRVRKLTARLEAKQDELRRNTNYRLSLYENYEDGIIPKEDFISFNLNYDAKIQVVETAIISLKNEIERVTGDESQNHDWIGLFKEYLNSETLNRRMAVELIERISIHEKGRIEVAFRYFNEYECLSYAVDNRPPQPMLREVV